MVLLHPLLMGSPSLYFPVLTRERDVYA